MLLKDNPPPMRRWPRVILLAGLLAIIPAASWLGSRSSELLPDRASGPFRARAGHSSIDASALASEIPLLWIEIPKPAVAILQRARDRAMAAGVIENLPEDTVKATVRWNNTERQAQLRLKGDWTDHVDSDRWSFRIKLDDGTLFGMSEFSIQHPKTRGVISEWLIMQAARQEGLLTPRSFYVNAVINGRASGVYYLEEHFSKHLLESQGRRDGPIVKFNEETLWSTWLHYHPGGSASVPKLARYGMRLGGNDAKAFNEKSLAKNEALNERLMRSLDQMMEIQNRIVVARPEAALGIQPKSEAARRALRKLQGRSVEELFVVDKVGKQAALMVIFGATHWLHWIQWRFYHDPILDRLEPVIFDTGANFGAEPPLAEVLNSSWMRDLLRSTEAYDHFYRALRRYCSDEWLDSYLDAIDQHLQTYAELLAPDLRNLRPVLRERLGIQRMPDDIEKVLRERAAKLRKLLSPPDPANFVARIVPSEDNADMIEVEAWSNTWVPTLVKGFRFGSGRIKTAASALVVEDQEFRRPNGYAVLPYQGRQVRFRFPVDQRLQSLQRVQAILNAGRDQTPDQSVRISVEVLYQVPDDAELTIEHLVLRRETEDSLARAGKPSAPLLSEALRTQPCLRYDAIDDQLFLRTGIWELTSDLLLPRGLPLHAEPGTTLRFAPDAALISPSALIFSGTEAEPIRFEPLQEEAGWPGIIVSECEQESIWQHVIVRRARNIVRGGWQTTGGITFYRAPLRMTNVRIEDALGEDALNAVHTTIDLREVVFSGGISDLFDGDFVNGTIQNCVFEHSAQDALDFSGSNILIEQNAFDDIGDKALSIGEDTSAEVIGGKVSSAAIGIAVKDRSHLIVHGFEIVKVQFYGLAAYVKKEEYGPSVVEAEGLIIGDCGRKPVLVQSGCRVSLDGVIQAGEELDIDELYRQRVLGK